MRQRIILLHLGMKGRGQYQLPREQKNTTAPRQRDRAHSGAIETGSAFQIDLDSLSANGIAAAASKFVKHFQQPNNEHILQVEATRKLWGANRELMPHPS
jgi:hypothetical protein